MSANPPSAHEAALARMSVIFDRAAEQAQIPPDEFRAEICRAMAYTQAQNGESKVNDTPEAFVLSLIKELF